MSVMLRIAVGAAFLGTAGAASAQDVKPVGQAPAGAPAAAPARVAPVTPPAKPEDVRSLDAIITAFYAVISGDAGVKRDWDRFRSLFRPGARMIPTGRNAKGEVAARIASVEDYITANQGFLEGEGFHEVELHRHTDSFGTVSHVFSVYEARKKTTDEKPFLRGVNNIQLLNDGKRWWILTVAWSPETAENPLPQKYLQKAER